MVDETAKTRPRPHKIRPEYQTLHDRTNGPLQTLVVVAALATIPVIIAQVRGSAALWVAAADWAIWLVFVAELGIGSLCARKRLRYLARSWLGAAIVVLSFPLLPDLLASLRIVRAVRLVRVARLTRLLAVTHRGMHAWRHSVGGQSVAYLGGLTLLLTLAGGALLAFLEPGAAPRGFVDGVWWAMVTVTTVGYGDIAPTTLLGRLLAITLMLCGLGLLSTLAAAISAFFIETGAREEASGTRTRLDQIEQKLDRLLEAKESEKRE